MGTKTYISDKGIRHILSALDEINPGRFTQDFIRAIVGSGVDPGGDAERNRLIRIGGNDGRGRFAISFNAEWEEGAGGGAAGQGQWKVVDGSVASHWVLEYDGAIRAQKVAGTAVTAPFDQTGFAIYQNFDSAADGAVLFDSQVPASDLWVNAVAIQPAEVTVGDGVNTFGDFNRTDFTSDDLLFVAARDALPAQGGRIVVKAGNYNNFAAPVNFGGRRIDLIGSLGATLIDGGSLSSAFFVFEGASSISNFYLRSSSGFMLSISGGCSVRRCTFDGTLATGSGTPLIIDGSDISVQNCSFFGSASLPQEILFEPNFVERLQIANCTFGGASTTAISTNPPAGVRTGVSIVGCTFGANYSRGIFLNLSAGSGEGAGARVIRDCVFEDGIGDGTQSIIEISGGQGITITDCSIVNAQVAAAGGGIKVAAGAVVVRNCHLDYSDTAASSGGYGISASGNDVLIAQCRITGVDGANSWREGIAFLGSSNLTVESCHIVGCEGSAIALASASSNVKILGNLIEDCGNESSSSHGAIEFHGSATEVLVQANQINRQGQTNPNVGVDVCGLRVGGVFNGTISSNLFEANGRNLTFGTSAGGIRFQAATGNFNIVDNVFLDNNGPGISTNSDSNPPGPANIQDCVVSCNEFRGAPTTVGLLDFGGTCTRFVMTGNRIEDTGTASSQDTVIFRSNVSSSIVTGNLLAVTGTAKAGGPPTAGWKFAGTSNDNILVNSNLLIGADFNGVNVSAATGDGDSNKQV